MSDSIDIGVPDLSAQGAVDLPPLENPTLDPPAPSGEGRPKRKRGRPPGKGKPSAPPAPAPAGPSPEDVGRLTVAMSVGFQVVGNILASARGPHWQFTQEECATLGEAWAIALAPYMTASGKYLPFILAGTATIGVVMPRLMQDREPPANRALHAAPELPAHLRAVEPPPPPAPAPEPPGENDPAPLPGAPETAPAASNGAEPLPPPELAILPPPGARRRRARP